MTIAKISLHCILKETPPIQFSILNSDSDLRETDLRKNRNKTALIEQTLAVGETPYCYLEKENY